MSDAAEFYTGLVADAYAALKSTSFPADRYLEFVRTHGEPALEIGCGDGDPLLDLCAAGLEVDGVDSSADMVRKARARADARGLSVTVYHQRMESLDTDRRYRSIYLAGPTFTLLPDDDTALAALTAIASHLTDDGAALVPLWIPEPTSESDFGVAREAQGSDGSLLRFLPVAEEYDAEARTRTTAVRYERVGPQGEEEVAERDWIIHWQTEQSFTGLAAAAGLAVTRMERESASEFSAVVARAKAAAEGD